MTSSLAASKTSLITIDTVEVFTNAKTKNIVAATTDIPTKAKTSAATPITNKTITTTTGNSTSKIPYPLATLLTDKTNQFRRSGSLRLRGSKSNLLLNTFNTATTDDYSMETEHINAVNTRTTKDHVAHEVSTTAGRVSPRRKLVLTSPNFRSENLRRSLSLRRNYNPSHKTDSNKESSTAAIAESLKDLQLKDNINGEVVVDTSAEREVPDGIDANFGNEKTGSNAASAIDEMEAKQDSKCNQKMSLNLNGVTTTSPTTTNTVTTTRPATLATTAVGNGNATALKSATTTTPKTPKTPTINLTASQQQQQHYNQYCHSKHSSQPHHCSRQQLSSVPETKLTPKTPPVTPDSPSTYLDDDLDSLYSFATTTSGRSTMSCEHPYVARNGTTFSGRKMKYVVHCSNHAGQVGPDYLTPTQRAQRQIRRLKELLCVARQDLEQKDTEILRLTREVVELRLFKASLSSPEERSASSDAVTVREAELKTSQDVSPIVDMVDDALKSSPRHIITHHCQQSAMQLSSEMQSSFADSGHFEDMTSSSVHSKDSYAGHHHTHDTCDTACGSDEADDGNSGEASGGADNYELQRQELIRLYEQRIEELIRTQDGATSEIKRTHNDKVEALLQKLAECNTRYADIVPDYEHAKERIRELEKQLEDLQRKLAEHEEKQNKMYLHMYQQGQEAERIARADQALELAHRAPDNKVSINELLHQLQNTQDELENIRTIYRRLMDAQKTRTHVDPEVTLQFLKSAVYYFLTDKENSQGHLQAIESILEFTEAEKQNISKARTPK